MKKLLTATLIASTFFTTNVFADGHHGGRDGHFGKSKANPTKIYRKLDLTEEQKTQLKAIFAATRTDEKKSPEAFKAQMDKRRALIEADALDMNAVNQLADEQTTKMKARFVKMTEAEYKAWHILTPEQQTKAKKMIQKRAERMEKRFQKRNEK